MDYSRTIRMDKKEVKKRLAKLYKEHEILIYRQNKPVRKNYNGICYRYKHPVLTAEHTPVHWRYDLNPKNNPYFMERLGVNATFNAGAILLNDKYYQVVRVEGWDRKSFLAVAESANGIDKWRFWDYPVTLPVTDTPETNVSDMRLTQHEDGWIYGIFCAERNELKAREHDEFSTIANAGIARTKDLKNWERLPDLKSRTQQRNVVLHPEFVNGKYALYTCPQGIFINEGSGVGIGWTLIDSMENAEITADEIIIDELIFHTIKESKNGLGPPPIKTDKGWLNLAHGVRECITGSQYVLYMFLTSLEDPSKVIARPSGYFLAPEGEERIGIVPSVLFANGWVKNKKDEVFIYYASADTKMHVATSSVEQLLDYVLHTPEDGLISYECVQKRNELISRNLEFLRKKASK